jgi:hypothetical protein
MSYWAKQKQFKYISIVLLFVIVVLSLPVYYIFFRKVPSCYDNILNQDEAGIDCGGVCDRVCPLDAQKPIVHWQRFFKVLPGVYTVVANIENPNIKVYAENVPYRFRLLDKDGVVIAERTGTTFLYPNRIFPIFESALQTGERVPARAEFQFTAEPSWQKKAYELPNLVVIDQQLSGSTTPRIDATLQSNADYRVNNIEVVTVVYDNDNNAIGASYTNVDSIGPKAKVPVFFTWPSPFVSEISKIDIIPLVIPRNLDR